MIPSTHAANPYLRGSYAPIDDEVTSEDLQIIGEIPTDLSGVYVRNGPNPRFPPQGRYHWFDGDGMLHAVHLDRGRITYRNRWVRTAAFEREAAAGEPLWRGIREPAVSNPKGAPLKDTANTDVLFHNGRLQALWYLSGTPHAVDPRTLETRGPDDFGGLLRTPISAHAKVDPRTGELMFFHYATRAPYMTYGVVSAQGQLAHTTPIDLPGPRLPHDMAITEHYSILMDLPWFPDAEALQSGRHKVVWHQDMPSRFGVLPRRGDTASIRWFEADPCYVYHTVNAWEEGDEIVLIACRMANPEPPETAGFDADRWMAYIRADARMYRWRFNLRTGAVSEGALDDANTEFPSINHTLLGRRSRYAYNVRIAPTRTLLFDALVKHDTETGRTQTHEFGSGRWGSEAPFAPRIGATAEDDGYLLSFVHDERENASELLILDARDLTRAPVARARLPRRVPLGFHACWVPGNELPPNG